ncbi:rho termination [Lasius niger]|uniref:Rho termination n=1 Tax=Lasius niger TaxID=67767 RepID=A0A0J7NLE0_LASNI|nr:rho termination [Lasius niger]
MPIFGEEIQVKRRDKRGTLGLSQGFEGSGLHGNSLAVGTGYEQNYLGGASLGHGASAPAYSPNYNTPLYSSHRLDYSRGLGYGGLGHGGPGYSSGGLGHATTRLGYGATGLGYGAAGLGYNAAGLGYNAAGLGYNAARQGYNAAGYDAGLGYSTGLSTGYRHGW